MPILAQNRPKLNCYFLPDSLEGRRVQTRHQSYGLRWRGVLSEPCQHLVPSWLLAETMSAIIVSAGFFPSSSSSALLVFLCAAASSDSLPLVLTCLLENWEVWPDSH